MRCTTRLASERFDPAEEYQAFTTGLQDEGAVVTFLGTARPNSSDSRPVTNLFLDHHPRMTEVSLDAIGEDAGRRFDIAAVYIVHRCGDIAPGEPIVFVAVAAGHRRAAFEAADYAMDRLKTDAVFWKREDSVDGSRWIEPTSRDRADRARWSE